MTIQELETGKKLLDAINANERVLEYLKTKEADPDKKGILVNFLTQCNNLHASISKNELGDVLFEHLKFQIEDQLQADKKALDAL